MAIEDIDLGTIPLDGTDGDTAREAFTKVNGNFDELDTRVTALENEPEAGTVNSVNGILPNSSGNVSLTAANVGAATTAQGLLADSAVQPGSLGTAAYQDANSFALAEDLQNYERVLTAGDNIIIDRTDPLNPIISSEGGSTITAEQVKQLYESNPNTNAFTDLDKESVNDIAGENPRLNYSSGVVVERLTQVIVRDGVEYRIKDPSELPYTLTGNWTTESSKFASMGDSGLRQDLQFRGAEVVSGVKGVVENIESLRNISGVYLPKSVFVMGYHNPLDGGGGEYILDAQDVSSADDGGGTIVSAAGVRWKLKTLNVDIRQFGAVPGNDISDSLIRASNFLYAARGGVVHVNQSYTASKTLPLYPYVEIRGGGIGKGSRIDASFSGLLFETIKPEGYTPPLCYAPKVNGLTLVGRGTGQGSCFSLKNCGYAKISGNEIANFGVAFDWNRGSSSADIIQSYFNVIEQNLVKPCGVGHRFGGAANRNTISTNSISDCLVAYDFSQSDNYSETNTFLNENIEGCHSWAEWSSAVYSQTWIGICIENPSTNGFTCVVKDPGRQVFVNLSMIPYGNALAVDFYSINAGERSMVLGSAASSGNNRTGLIVPEELKLYNVVNHIKFHGSSVFSGTIAAGGVSVISVTVGGARLNDRADAYALRTLQGCCLQAYVTGNDIVQVNLINATNSAVTINSVEISCIVKRCT